MPDWSLAGGEVTDDEVLGIMVDGGRKLCEYAKDQWIGDKYKLGEDVRRAHITRWSAIEHRIGPLAKELKGRLGEGK